MSEIIRNAEDYTRLLADLKDIEKIYIDLQGKEINAPKYLPAGMTEESFCEAVEDWRKERLTHLSQKYYEKILMSITGKEDREIRSKNYTDIFSKSDVSEMYDRIQKMPPALQNRVSRTISLLNDRMEGKEHPTQMNENLEKLLESIFIEKAPFIPLPDDYIPSRLDRALQTTDLRLTKQELDTIVELSEQREKKLAAVRAEESRRIAEEGINLAFNHQDDEIR